MIGMKVCKLHMCTSPYAYNCSWSRPIGTKSVFSRLVMFIQT